MIEKIAITDTDVIEQIRRNIPVATSGRKGLSEVIIGNVPNWQYIELNNDNSVEFDFSYGTIFLKSMQKGYSSIIIAGAGYARIANETGMISLSTEKNAEGKVNIYKNGEFKFVIQNKIGEQFRFYICIL